MHKRKRMWFLALLASLMLVVGACGSGDDDDDDDNTSPTPSATNTAPEATFTWIQANVIPRCGGPTCHGSNSGSPITNYGQFRGPVENTTGGCSTADDRIVDNDPANSILYGKLTTTPPCGARMPASGAPLTALEIQAIADWINLGAPNN